MQQTNIPSYASVAGALESVKSVVSISEAHGLLCGLLCGTTTKEIDGASWVQSLMDSADPSKSFTKEHLEVLKELFDVTRYKLEEMDFDFELLLPDDNQELPKRAKELGQWCLGFMAGVGLSGIQLDQIQSEDSKDALGRISEISNIQYDMLEIREEDESAYVEVVEFVRMAVIMIYADLAGESRIGISGSDQPHLH